MSEFNGKKYYGFSLHNDPALLTTTRNFEFRYTRPENLERVIQKVQLSDGAEAKQKKLLLAKYCKLKKRELSTPFQTRDVDVETHVSRNELKKVRELSENEIDQLIGKAKSTISMVGDESAGGHVGESGDGGNNDDGAAAMGDAAKEGEKLSEQNIPLDSNSPKTSKSSAGIETSATKKMSAQMDTVIIEEIRHPQPKWVEIEEAPRFEHLTVAELKLPHRIFRRETKTLSLPTVAWQQIQQTQQQQEALQQQKQTLLTQSQTQTSLTNHLNQQTVNYDEVAPSSYYVEDSDYEYEMLKRPGYTKYCEQRPALDEMTNVSNESGGVPRFIEIEPHIPCMDLSFLKNANPIRYTDLTDEIQEEERVENQEMKVYIKGLKQVDATTKDTKTTEKSTKTKKQSNDKKHDTAKRKFFGSKSTSKPTTPITAVTTTLKSPQTSPRSKNVKNLKQREHSPQHSPKSFGKSPKSLTPRTPRMKNIFLTKSIEELKVEKVSLFNKMNATQERIIEILDKLRMNLLEIYVPDSSYDKSRRQKNAFEFSVRFSRNFLYPLKGMVEDLRTTTKEAFNSTTSNEACNRVANIYALILQSLQTYQRQLRFFSLDQVPQKLTALIDMIHATTNICLDKSIFAANDPIIDCLLERCTKFVGFLEDLHEERFVTARDASGKPCSDKSPTKHAAVHAKYDLKMFMNDLNMYEPKLVPKRLPAHSRYRNKTAANAGTSSNNTTARRRIRKIRKQVEEEKSANCAENSSQMMLAKATEDAITTQIQNYDYEGSSGLLASMQNMVAASNELCLEKSKSESVGNPLNQAVIEALQMVTKEQVRQVLEPIIQTLGSALDKKNNSETIEAILKALNTKIFSTTGDENKKRHDSRNSRMRSKVPDNRAADSTSSILNASTASKAVKHTKKRAERQKRTNTTSRSSSKNNKHNNSNNKSNEMYRNVNEIDGGDAGDAGNDANDSYSESNNEEEEEEWESLNDDNDDEELDIEKEFAVQVRSRSNKQQQQELKQQRQQEEASQQQKKQLKQQKPKTKQEQRTQQFLQRKKLQEQQLLQQQQQLKELHALQQQLRQKQIAQKTALMHRKHSVKHQNKQQQQQQQEPQHSSRVQHKSQDRLQQQRSGPQVQQQVQRKLSQRQVKEKLQTSERERREKLPLHQSLRQLRRPSGNLNPSAAVSNPLTTRKYSNSSTGTPMSAATPTAHSEVGFSQRPQKQQQQQQHQQQQQLEQHQQQQPQDQEQQNSHRRPAPCHKNKARLFKKRRNPLRSPPPAPAATPLTSARSKHSEQFEQTSELEATEDELNVSVEELPHAMTNPSNNNSSSYNRECNKYYNNNKYQNQNNSNNTGDSETITSRRHEVPPTAASIGDCSAATVSAAAAAAAAAAALQSNRSFELNPHEAAAAASAIAVALDTISVGEKTNVLNLLQTRVISDVLVKCLVGVNPVAVSSTQKSEDDFNDDDDDNEFDDDDDYDGEEEDNDEAGDNNKKSTNSKANVAATTARGNDDGSSDTESREVVEVASYVSTSKKRRGRKTLEQLVRQNYQEQLNAMYAKSPAFPIQQQQQQLHMQLLQQQQQQEPENQQELHLKLLHQQEQQKEPRSQQDLHAQYLQEQAEPQNQKQIHMQQLLLEQSMLLQPERTQQNQQQQLQQQQQQQQQQPFQSQQQQRRPLNEINYLHAHPSKTNNKENDLSQVFMEVMERNKQQLTVNRQKGDLNIDSLLNTRDQFLGLCKKNRFYSNPNYTEPWKVFSRLSAKLASEIVSSVEEDFSIGVSKFVQDFLELETHT